MSKTKISVLPLMIGSLLLFGGCAKEQQEDRSFDGMFKEASAAATKRNHRADAIDTLEQVIELHPEHRDISKVRRSLADLYFEQKEYALADNYYKKLRTFNPAESEYASYRSILCAFYQLLRINRDQTQAHKAVKRCKKFLATPEYKTHINEVKNIAYTAERALIDHEVYVFNFYLRHSKYQSAEHRLAFLRDSFLPRHSDLEPRLLFLEAKLALKQDKREVAQQKKQLLYDRFHTTQYADMVSGLFEKKSSNFTFI